MRVVAVAVALLGLVAAAHAVTLRGRASTPLDMLKQSASLVEQRFQEETSDRGFGKGLPNSLVNNVKDDSMEFWEGVKNLTPQDVADLDDGDGAHRAAIAARCPARALRRSRSRSQPPSCKAWCARWRRWTTTWTRRAAAAR